jgi:hypothetical protein
MARETPPGDAPGLLMRIRNFLFRMVGLTTEPLIVPPSKAQAQRSVNERASGLILELSHALFDLAPQGDAAWRKAYYRFQCNTAGNASAVCCRSDAGPRRIGTAPPDMDEKAEALIKLFGKSQGVLLLIVSADANYKVDFDWDDFGRWPVGADGAISGLPLDH